jgi:LPS-assembly lipoprotein
MWWHSALRLVSLAGLCLMLAACGFQPLYGRGGGAVTSADLDTVQLPVISEREGQILRNYLQESFNPDGRRRETRYLLDINLVRSAESLGVRRDGTATRVNLTLTAYLTLRTAGDGQEVFKGRALSTASYNILSERFATVASEQDAVRRAARTLATNIATRVAVILKSRKEKA